MLNVLTSPHDVADLEKFWKLESVGFKHDEENDTTNADSSSTYKRTAITHSDRKYYVQLPWKHDLLSYKLRPHTEKLFPTTGQLLKRRQRLLANCSESITIQDHLVEKGTEW